MANKALFLCLLAAGAAFGEVKTMTLREAIDVALKQNPDLMLARLDQVKARQQVNIARDPFSPKVFAGSGAAWTSGFPASVDGQAPSILQAQTKWTLFDRSQSYKVAQAREDSRTSEIDSSKRQDEVVYRVAALFLDAEQAAERHDSAQKEVENLARVLELVQARVEEKRALHIEASQANLALQKAKNVVEALALDSINARNFACPGAGIRTRRSGSRRPRGTSAADPPRVRGSIHYRGDRK